MNRPHLNDLRRALVAAAAISVAGVATDALANSPKRGFAGSSEPMITGLNASWYYTWWTDPNPAVTTAEFVPIMQNRWAVGAANQFNNNPKVTAVLGFNEPERSDQANLSVNEALDLWAQTQTSTKRLVSPAPSDTSAGRAWLQNFMSGASSRGYRVDAVAFHWYGDTRGGASSAAGFLGAVDWYWNTFKKPVWITEFGGIDWSGTNPISQSTNRAFLEAAAAGLESRSYVERYSWYQWDPACRLMNDDLTLTTIGDFYTGNTIVNAGQTMDLNTRTGGNTGNDVWYVRGGSITDTGSAGGHFMRRMLVTGSTGTITGSNNWTLKDYYLRIDPGASLAKTGSNTIDLENLKLDNNGTFNVNGGTLRLRGGITPAGSGGTLRVNIGGTLALANSSTGVANNLALPITLGNGGILRIDDGTQTLAASLTVQSTSAIDTAGGDLTLSQPMLGAGRLVKRGVGTLRLTSATGSPARTGITDVQAGTLFVQSTLATTILGSGSLTVGEAGTLAGTGSVVTGAATINGTLSPGLVDTSPGWMKFGDALTFGTNATLVVDAISSTSDKLALTSEAAAATVDGAIRFRIQAGFAADYGTGLTVLSAPGGIVGQFDRVLGLSLGDAKAIAVTYTATSVLGTVARTGDADLSGRVDFADLLTLAKHYGQASGSQWIDGDFDGDGAIAFSDLLGLAKQYGQSNVAASLASVTNAEFAADFALAQSLVPEPAALLGGLLLIAAAARRDRAREGEAPAEPLNS